MQGLFWSKFLKKACYISVDLKKGMPMMRLWIIMVSLSALLCGCVYVSGGTDGESSLKLSALDVGQGLAVLLEWDGRYAMYDFGPDSVGVVDSLARRGVDTLEWVVLSHYHRDHIGGFLELPGRDLFVRRLYVGSDLTEGFFRDSVLGVARALGIPVDTLWRGESLGFAEGERAESLRFDVLWPAVYARVEGNTASVVLLGRVGVTKVLLTGDLDTVGENRLLEMNPTLSAELLQVGHHGSAGSSSFKFIAQVSPKYAFVSVGADNRYGHPVESVVHKLNLVLGDSAKLFRTDLQGTVRFEIFPGMGVIEP